MLRRVRDRLTYSNVVATVALFCVLAGGVAVGAGLKKNSVGKKQLKKNAVVTKKLADGAVTSPKLADEAVTGDKVDLSSLGTVPSALQATDATNAANATNATNAVNAQSATTATTATNAQALDGHGLAGVRSAAEAGSNNPSNITLTPSYTEVIADGITAPAGGGTVTAFASIDIVSDAVVAGEVDCQLQAGRGGTFTSISQQTFSDLGAVVGFDEQVPLAGLKAGVPPGTETVRVVCREIAGTLLYDRGDIVVQVFPTG